MEGGRVVYEREFLSVSVIFSFLNNNMTEMEKIIFV